MNYLRYVVKRYLFAVIALVFIITYWISAYELPGPSIVFPRFITLVTIPIFIWVFVQSINEYRALAKDAKTPEKEKWNMSLRITNTKLVITGMTVVYIILVPIVGYCVTTVMYVGGLSYYLGNRSPAKLFLFTFLYFGITYAVFAVWLRIRMPEGFLI